MFNLMLVVQLQKINGNMHFNVTRKISRKTHAWVLPSYPKGIRRTCHACTAKTYCVTSGVWYVVLSPKNYKKNLEAIKKTENFSCILLMMVEHYKKMWVHLKVVGKKTPFGQGLRSCRNVLRSRRPIFRHIRNDLNFCK